MHTPARAHVGVGVGTDAGRHKRECYPVLTVVATNVANSDLAMGIRGTW